MDNNQSIPTPQYEPIPPQPSGPSGQQPKKRPKPTVIVVIIVAILAVAIGIGLLVAYLLGDGPKGSINGKSADTVTNSTAFISNKYSDGARVLSIEGSAKPLGLSKDGTKVAVWREGVNDNPSELTIYDAASLQRSAGSETTGCTTWHQQDAVLCAVSGSAGEAPTLKLHNMNDASLISQDVVYEHPSFNPNADTSSLAGLDYLGQSNDDHLFVVKASNSFLDPSDMTEQEAANATNFMGLYTVSSRLIVAVSEEGSVSWSREITDNDVCGLVSDGEVALCQDVTTKAESFEAILKTFNAANGEPMAERETASAVVVASDGWIESEEVDLSKIDENSSLQDLMKGTPLTIYGLDGEVERQAELQAGSLLGNMTPAPSWVPESRVAYSVDRIIESSSSGDVFDASGKVVASLAVNQAGVMEITSSGGDRVGTGSVAYVSADGQTLVVLDEGMDISGTGDDLFSGPTASLVSVEGGREIQTLDQGNLMLAELGGGLIATQTFGGLDSLESMTATTLIYVPGK